MRYKFLPSFARRKGRITNAQKKYLLHLDKFLIHSCQDIQTAAAKFEHISLEIGFGNGEDFFKFTQSQPQTLFIAAEVYDAGIGNLLGKIIESNSQNILIFNKDIRELLDDSHPIIFHEIFIICPDPWPKDRHHKRRLLQNNFFDMLNKRMTAESKLFISTDWDNYADDISGSLKSKNHNFDSRLISSIPSRDLSKFQKRAVTEGRRLHFFEVQKIR